MHDFEFGKSELFKCQLLLFKEMQTSSPASPDEAGTLGLPQRRRSGCGLTPHTVHVRDDQHAGFGFSEVRVIELLLFRNTNAP